ncbi:HAD superfamily phosphatase (TIGR01681 family)/FkbH-like protein [Alteromonadaceae bacterium 2753L.S.0a.02]|nr:HAD superfamily phosphatase (TIGR01681 family)/FkbH-like protein [Alteromonadaceae bacterium 2753L.S.0a.02]
MNTKTNITVNFNQDELNQFANLSRDHNPLHVNATYAHKTPFGQCVVFGALALIKCLQQTRYSDTLNLDQIDVEFHNTIFIDTDYSLFIDDDSDREGQLELKDGTRTLLRAKFSRHLESLPVISEVLDSELQILEIAADKALSDFSVGETFTGVYDLAHDITDSTFSEIYGQQYEQLISMLTSYLVGMETPGAQALFSKLHLDFSAPFATNSRVNYVVSIDDVDTSLGLLFLSLQVIHPNGTTIATGKLQAFVRSKLIRSDRDTLCNLLNFSGNQPLSGKTALVIGGSRGLGAEIVQVLMLAGANVFLNYANSDDEALALQNEFADLPNTLQLIKGSVSDLQFCKKTLNTILDAHNTLDFVICNACASPKVMDLDATDISLVQKYIADNLSLVANPLTTFREALSKSHGVFCTISSIYVETGSKDFPQYVALKNTVEALVKTESLSNNAVSHLVVRPPKLLTDMSNTPIGAIGALHPALVAADIVTSLANSSSESNYVVLNQFRDNDTMQHPVSESVKNNKTIPKDAPQVCVAATFSIDIVLTSLQYWSDKLSLPLQFSVTPYNQPFQELLSPLSSFHNNRSGYNIMYLRFEDWLPYLSKESQIQTPIPATELNHRALLEKTFSEFTEALQYYSQNTTTPLELFLCPSLEIVQKAPELHALLENMCCDIETFVNGLEQVQITITERYHSNYKVNDIRDALRFEMAHIPYTDTYFDVLGTLALRRLFNYHVKPYKVIVLDCDNTLWQGVCDEAGASGVIIDEHFKQFQEFLIAQKDKGILLCLCSKNREQAVWDVFEQHGDMVLRRADLVDAMINWQLKSENLETLASNLNLGLDSFIFIDDNPVECAEVRTQLPEVLTLQAPQNSQEFDQFIDHLWVLDKHQVTQEDKARTQMYQQDKERQEAAKNNTDFGSFLASLNLRVDFHDLDDSSISRAAQLTKRTNQFNLSTRRRSERDIVELTESNYLAFTLTVTDRFGDYGTVGLVLAAPQDKALFVDTFLLSCRVLGRGVEQKILANIAELAQARDFEWVDFEYIASAKNEPIANFLNIVCDQLGYADKIDPSQEKTRLRFKVNDLIELQFDPASAKSPGNSTGHAQKSARKAAASANQLQVLFENTIFPLKSEQLLHQAITPDIATIKKSDTHPPNGQSQEECAQRVIQIFSRVLSLNPNVISLQAPIENIVDESYKIVDLTVALKSEFPNLPQTLLFETRNLQDIVDKISGRSLLQNSEVVQQNVSSSEDIAIIGMDGRFPGADNLEDFWENLKNGICSMSDIPRERWDADSYYSADMSMADKTYCTRGGFINNGFKFDHQFFGISPREAETMDPQQRLFLQAVWGTIENAGYTRNTLPRNTGVYLGVISSDYALNAYQAALSGWSHYRMSDFYQIPNRVSYYFDLNGPSLAIDSACSSSASALHLACHSLKRGECETAIVGGVNFIAHPSRLIQYAQMQMISKSGNCSPFSDAADGTLFGEGVCALLLKPLSKALADGDVIHGVIKSTAVNSGGKTNGFTVPSPTAHARLISQALVEANIHPRSISYIEAHGTATNLGDPIEIRGVTEGFSAAEAMLETTPYELSDKHWCAIGSVKSNIGHLESCAALAGIVKCLLQMKHQTLVPSLTQGNYDASQTPLPPNSKIDFETTPLKIQYHPQTWESTAELPRRAGISSFGAGGSNGHVIIEEAPALNTKVAASSKLGSQAAIFSAPSRSQLESVVQRTLHFLQHNNISFDNLCYTLQLGREHFNYRLAVPCENLQQLTHHLVNWLSNETDEHVQFQKIDEAFQPYTVESKKLFHDGLEQWLKGHDVDWEKHYPERLQKIALPGLEFQGREFTIPAEYLNTKSPVQLAAETQIAADNVFLGLPLDSPQISNTLFETRYDLGNLPYLTDHRIYDSVVVPGSMYVAYALTVAGELWPHENYRFSNLTFIRALLPDDDQVQRVQFSASPQQDGSQALSIFSRERNSQQWHEHFSCLLQPSAPISTPQSITTENIINRMSNTIAVDEFYKESVDIGFCWGPQFQCVKQLYRRDGEALGLVTLVDSLLPSRDQYAIHPAFLDACFQVFVPGMSSTGLQKETRQAYLPLGVNEVHFYRPVPVTVWSHVITKDDLKKDSLSIDIYLYTESGEVVAYFKEMQVLRASKEALMALAQSQRETDLSYAIDWQTLPTENAAEQQNPVVVFSGSSLHKPLQSTSRLRSFQGEDSLQQALATQLPVNVIHTIEPVYAAQGSEIQQHLLSGVEQIQALIRRFDNTVYSPGIKLYLAIQTNEQLPTLERCFVSLARVLAIEYPQLWGGFIDIDKNGVSENQLLQIFSQTQEDHFQVGADLQVPRLKPVEATAELPQFVHDEGSYLITGAFGSLGQLATEHLLKLGAKKLLLVSRREPDASQHKFMESIKQRGAEVVHAAIDLANRDALQVFINKQRDTLKGVIHLAGLLEDGAFTNLTQQQFHSVLSPKVSGTWHLHQCTENIPLDFFVLYSSASSLLGAAGQANYAIANGFMDAFAQYRRNLGLAATAVNWGPWAGAGMAAEQDSRRKTWTNASFGSLSADHGMQYLSAICSNTKTPAQLAVLPYDWNALLQHYPVAKIPSLLRNLAQRTSAGVHLEETSQADDDIAAFCVVGLASAERKRLVIQFLRKQVRNILGFNESDAVEANRSFLSIGFDSLMAVSFRTTLANNLNCYFPATIIFDYPNLNQLSDYIVAQLEEAEQQTDNDNETQNKGNEIPLERSASHTVDTSNALNEIDIHTLNQDQVEQLLESELDEIERILEA